MNCQDIEKRLEDYLRHELGSKEMQFFELHVMSCAVCNEVVKRARILHRELQNLTSMAVPKDFVLKVHRRVESLHQPRWVFQPLRWPAGVLASLIIGVFVFRWILPYHPIPGKPSEKITMPQERDDQHVHVSSPERTQVSSFEESRSKQTGAGSQASEKMDQNSQLLEEAEGRPSSSNFFSTEQEELIPVVTSSFSSVRKSSEKDKVSSVEQPLRGELKSDFAVAPEYDKGDRSEKMVLENLSPELVPSGNDEPLVNAGSARLERWSWRPKEKKITFLEEYLSDQKTVWFRDQNGVYHVQIIQSRVSEFLNLLKGSGSLEPQENQKSKGIDSSDHEDISISIELTIQS